MALSRHGRVHCTCPLSGPKRTQLSDLLIMVTRKKALIKDDVIERSYERYQLQAKKSGFTDRSKQH